MTSFEFTFYVCEQIVRIVLRHRDVIHLLASAVGFMIRWTGGWGGGGGRESRIRKVQSPKKSFDHPLRSTPLPLGRRKRTPFLISQNGVQIIINFCANTACEYGRLSSSLSRETFLRREARKDSCIRGLVMITCRV